MDGIRWVRTGLREGNPDRIIVSGKDGGNVAVRDARDLAGTVQRKSALGGVLTTLAAPTREMLREAASYGDAWSSRSLCRLPPCRVLSVHPIPLQDTPPAGWRSDLLA